MKEKIRKWEDEIAQIVNKQREMTQKNNDRIRELRKKIQQAQAEQELATNQRIAETVREIYGDVDDETIAVLKEQLIRMKEEKTEKALHDDGNGRL